MRTFELKMGDQAREAIRIAADESLALVAGEALEGIEDDEKLKEIDLTFRLCLDDAGDFQVKVSIEAKYSKDGINVIGEGAND